MTANVSQLAPLCVAVPLAAAALLAPLSGRVPRAVSCALASAAAAAVIVMAGTLAIASARAGMILHWMGGWKPRGDLAIGISLAVDPIGAGLAAFVGLLVLVAIVYTWIKFDLVGTLFHTLLLAFMAAMCGYALTGDLFNMFVWFELMTAAAIALTAHRIEDTESLEGALNLAVVNTLGGFLVLLGIGCIYARTDALNFAQIGLVLNRHPADALVMLAFALIACGYFVKGAVAPFHFWLDDAHAVSPTPVCVLFSGIMVQLALYGVARTYWTVFAGTLAPYHHHIGSLFIGVGVVTALVGAVMAFAQQHLKRLLAFSTVSHSGIFVAALGLFGAAGAAACAAFIIAHGLIKSALFICAGNYLNRFRSLDVEALGGKGREARWNTAAFLIGGVALAGLPPLAIFAAKALYDAAFQERGLVAVAVLAGIASALDAGAVLQAGLHIAFGIGKPQCAGISPREEATECEGDHLERTPWTMASLPFVLLLLALGFGLSTGLLAAISRASSGFVNQMAYVAAVLHTVHATPVTPPAVPPLADAIGINLAISAGAVLAAFAALYRERIPRFFGSILLPPLRALRAAHSGIFTDYVAYLTFGVAAYTTALLLFLR